MLASAMICGCSPTDQKLQDKADALEAKNAALEERLATLERKLARLKQMLPATETADEASESEKDTPAANPKLAKIFELYPQAIRTPSGLSYIVTKEGTGETTPKVGNVVTAHYTGTFMNGEKFDSSIDRNRPYEFKVGLGNVIKGWDEAFLSMNAGEKRTLIIPPWLAYGDKDFGPIPGKSTLLFDVELIAFK